MTVSPPIPSKPSGARRPAMTVEDAQVMASRLYGFEAEVQELPGDRDRNYLLSTSDDRFVLKIAGPWAGLDGLEFQNAALDHLSSTPDLRVAKVWAAGGGEKIAFWQDREGRECKVRLISFLPGKTLVQACPRTPSLFRSIGRYMGLLDRALEGFEHPGMMQVSDWDLQHAGRALRARSDDVDGPERRALIDSVLQRFEQYVEPVLPSLRQAVIHSDGNDHNLLVEGGELGDLQITGVIDFGDMMYTHRVHEVAIACAYAGYRQEDPLRVACWVTGAYHEVYPLQEQELALLYDLICARVAVSVSMAAYQRRLEPDNEYLSVSEVPGWEALTRLSAVDPELAHCALRSACGLPASPKKDRVVTWLRQQQDNVGKVVDGDLSTAPILDLSVGSSLSVGRPLSTGVSADPADANALQRHVAFLLEAPGVDVAVGRYDEPRLLYTAAQFAPIPGLEHLERRTIHLGIDLFQPAGSPVYAPLSGTIHSFADNAVDLDYGPTLILRHETDDPEPVVFYTLYGHLSRESLEGKMVGMSVSQGDLVARLGDRNVNGGWAPHLHFQLLLETFGREGEFPGVAAPSDRKLWTDLCPNADLIVGIGEDSRPLQDRGLMEPGVTGELLARRQRVLGRNLSISYRQPLHIVAGRGCYLFDAEGRAYLDAVNNVPHVGHCHPKVVAAGQGQMAVLNTNTRYLHDDLVRYAERLTATFPDPLNVCVFCCTGSEANDLALRMARAHTGGGDMIVVDAAYHGHTKQLIELSPYKFDGPGGGGSPETTHVVPLPCGYRGPYKHDDPKIGERYADHVATACAAAQDRGQGVAAFICESILGCGGQVVLPPGYLKAAYDHVRAVGGLCMADEVQVGFGRVGSHMWAFETQGVVPDIVTLGKPIGNGHPLSAVITTAEIADSFANGMEYFNTFGGNPVSCKIGLAVLDVIEQEGLQENALRTGELLLSRLKELQACHPIIGEVRGLGLFVGVELVRDPVTLEPAADEASYIAERMRDHGILISTDGPLHNVLKIKPPMVFGEEETVRLVDTLHRILAEDRIS